MAASRYFQAFVAILVYMLSGLAIILLNKSVVRDSGLYAPALVSSTGAIFTAALTRFLVAVRLTDVKPVGNKPWDFAFLRALPVGIFAAGSLCFGNMAYMYLDTGCLQVMKSGTPGLLFIVLVALGEESMSGKTIFLISCMVLGSALSASHMPEANLTGLLVQSVSQLCEVAQCALVQLFLKQLGFDALDAGYYLAPAIGLCCLLASLYVEWPQLLHEQKVHVLFNEFPWLCLSGLVGVVVNLSSLWVIKLTSSLLAKLLAIARSSCLVIFFWFMGERFATLQIIGYAMTVLAFTGYVILKFIEIKQDTGVEYQQAVEEETPQPLNFDLMAFMFWPTITIILFGSYTTFIMNKMDVPGKHGSKTIPSGSRFVAGPPDALADGSSELLDVRTSAHVLYLEDGRFLVRSRGAAVISQRAANMLLSSSWLISSSHFGAVQLRGFDENGASSWLTCDLGLSLHVSEACLLSMTALTFDSWSKDNRLHKFIFRRYGSSELSLATNSSSLVWSLKPSPFLVADWVPESCPIQGMQPAPQRYTQAQSEVTLTMMTVFQSQARRAAFREVLSSVLAHLKDRNEYVRELLVMNEWYEGNAKALNGTLTGPSVQQSRREMLDFFPGCHGISEQQASKRPKSQSCTFILRSGSAGGRARSFNLLLDLMVTEFWINLEDDQTFHQDFYISRLLQPIYEQKEKCLALIATTTQTRTTTAMLESGPTSRHHRRRRSAAQTTATPSTTSSMLEEPHSEPTIWPTLPTVDPSDPRLWPSLYTEAPTVDPAAFMDWNKPQTQTQPETSSKEEDHFDAGRFEAGGDFTGGLGMGWAGHHQRQLSQNEDSACLDVAGVKLYGSIRNSLPSQNDSYEVEVHDVPGAFFNNSYIQQLIGSGLADGNAVHRWGLVDGSGASRLPLFTLTPYLFNLTYIKSLEAPLFHEGRPGRFAENLSEKQNAAAANHAHSSSMSEFILEFAVRFARGGATLASVSPGACTCDVSSDFTGAGDGLHSFDASSLIA